MPNLLTIEETKQFFKVKDNRTIHKFIRQGLKCFKVGTRDYRFDPRDIEEFVNIQKQIAQEDLQIKPIKIKTKAKCKTVNIDFQKRKINLEMNRVV